MLDRDAVYRDESPGYKTSSSQGEETLADGREYGRASLNLFTLRPEPDKQAISKVVLNLQPVGTAFRQVIYATTCK